MCGCYSNLRFRIKLGVQCWLLIFFCTINYYSAELSPPQLNSLVYTHHHHQFYISFLFNFQSSPLTIMSWSVSVLVVSICIFHLWSLINCGLYVSRPKSIDNWLFSLSGTINSFSATKRQVTGYYSNHSLLVAVWAPLSHIESVAPSRPLQLSTNLTNTI